MKNNWKIIIKSYDCKSITIGSKKETSNIDWDIGWDIQLV